MVAFLLLITLLSGGRAALHTSATKAADAYRVRIAYVIPSDRRPQPNYQDKAAVLLSRIQTFYADQMEANGFGRMTFSFEAGSDGRPDVHVIHSSMTAAVFADTGHAKYVAGKYWDHAFQSVIEGGFAPDAQGEVWLCFVEAQDQLTDGSIHNDSTQGDGRFGNGFTLCTGLELALGGDPDLIHDHRKYGGLVIPAIGPHPLQWHVSFPQYQGDDVSSLAADYMSATAHELGHCFLLKHTYLNDSTLCGDLMGNGFRGWRGYFMPNRFPAEDTRLARPSALMLRLCPFFRKLTELVKYSPPPRIAIETPSGAMTLDKGKLRISFTASDPGGPGIALATLENGINRDNVGVVAWQEFDGKTHQVHGFFETTAVNPEKQDTWRISILDAEGNIAYQTVKLAAPRTGVGPSPFITVGHSQVKAGVPVHFLGSVKRPWKFSYRWDFGDGSRAEGASVAHAFAKPGVYEVRLSAIDPGGRAGETSLFMSVRNADVADR